MRHLFEEHAFEAAPKPAFMLPDKPSIAILPFTNLSSDSDRDYFAGGVVVVAPDEQAPALELPSTHAPLRVAGRGRG